MTIECSKCGHPGIQWWEVTFIDGAVVILSRCDFHALTAENIPPPDKYMNWRRIFSEEEALVLKVMTG